MGYCGTKISGHSGTDFKHNKAFTKSKKILNNERIFTDVRIESREPTLTYTWFSRVKSVIAILFIFVFLMVLFTCRNKVNIALINDETISTELLESNSKSEKREAAILMYNSSKSYYKSGALDHAQDEITRVLKLYPTNLEVLQLMQNILDKQCEVNNKHCESAEHYRQYLAVSVKD